MPVHINPDDYCSQPDCTRPRATGEDLCSPCSRLARSVGRSVPFRSEGEAWEAVRAAADEARSIAACRAIWDAERDAA